MLTIENILDYKKEHGARAAANLLLLTGPDGFDGNIDDYNYLLNDLNEEASDISEEYTDDND